MLPEGKYRAQITDYGVMQSRQGANHPTVFVTFKLLAGPEAEPLGGRSLYGVMRTYYRAITPKTMRWVRAELKAIGYDRDELKYLDAEAEGAVDLFGRDIDVVCRHEEYDNNTRERWSIDCGPAHVKLSAEDLERLDEQFAAQAALETPPGNPSLAADGPLDATM